MVYRAKATSIGNSKGHRHEAKLFSEHPEFAEGEFDVHVLGPGCMLLTTVSPETEGVENAEPCLPPYLRFIGEQMDRLTMGLRVVTPADLKEAQILTRGVQVDVQNDRLDDDFVLP
jgi:hypothetical protein